MRKILSQKIIIRENCDSDQGLQFTSKAYHELTEQKNILLSMSRAGNFYNYLHKLIIYSIL